MLAKKSVQSSTVLLNSHLHFICTQLLDIPHAKPCARHWELQSGRGDRRQTVTVAPHLTQERQERLPGENNSQAELEQMERSKPEHGVGGIGRRISRQEEQQAPRKEKVWHVPKWPRSRQGGSGRAGHVTETSKELCHEESNGPKLRTLDFYLPKARGKLKDRKQRRVTSRDHRRVM